MQILWLLRGSSPAANARLAGKSDGAAVRAHQEDMPGFCFTPPWAAEARDLKAEVCLFTKALLLQRSLWGLGVPAWLPSLHKSVTRHPVSLGALALGEGTPSGTGRLTHLSTAALTP